MLAGSWVRETKVNHDIDSRIKEMIARMCERHSGEWTSSKRSKIVLPEPETEMEIFVHECDILSSRSDIDMQPSDYLKSVFGEEKAELPDVNEYVLDFGRHKGSKLIDVFKKHRDYINWCKENFRKEPFISLVQLLEKTEQSQEDDEI
jgi:hypothetical protein